MGRTLIKGGKGEREKLSPQKNMIIINLLTSIVAGGAAAGTAVAPGAGTVVGAIVGGVIALGAAIILISTSGDTNSEVKKENEKKANQLLTESNKLLGEEKPGTAQSRTDDKRTEEQIRQGLIDTTPELTQYKIDQARTNEEKRAELSMNDINTPLYTENNGKNEDDKNKTPIIGTPIPEIKDETNNNVETPIESTKTVDDWIKFMQEQQKARWDREDKIRKETQRREDTAYQRAIKDAQRAGINVNLLNIQPAASGGGITQASGMDMSTISSQMDIDLKEMQQLIDQAFEGKENEKDRFNTIFGNILSYVTMYLLFKK